MFRRRTRSSSCAMLTVGLFFSASLALQSAQANEQEQEEADAADDAENGVVIKAPKQKTIDEYRVNGKLYMIRITPEKGAPYYLVDADGDGNLETRSNELAPDFLIPSWVIFSW